MKKLLIVMLSVVACVCLCLFAACGDNESDSVAVESVTLDKSELTLTVGEDETLTATVSPDNATDKTVIWESSDTSVATVTGGKVTAVKAGEATITAKAGDKSATCSVTVNSATVKEDTDVAGKAFKCIDVTDWTYTAINGYTSISEEQFWDESSLNKETFVAVYKTMSYAFYDGKVYVYDDGGNVFDAGNYVQTENVIMVEYNSLYTGPSTFTVSGNTLISELFAVMGTSECTVSVKFTLEYNGEFNPEEFNPSQPDNENDPARAEWINLWENLACVDNYTMKLTYTSTDKELCAIQKYDSVNNIVFLDTEGYLTYTVYDFENATKTEYKCLKGEESNVENWTVYSILMFGEEDTRANFLYCDKWTPLCYQMMVYYDVFSFNEETNTYSCLKDTGEFIEIVFEDGNVKSIEIIYAYGETYSVSEKYEMSNINSTDVTIPQAALDVPEDEIIKGIASSRFYSESYTGSFDAKSFYIELCADKTYNMEIITEDYRYLQGGTFTVGKGGALTFTVFDLTINGSIQSGSIQLEGVWIDYGYDLTLTFSYNGESSTVEFGGGNDPDQPWEEYPDDEYDPARAEWEAYWENLANSQSYILEETLTNADGADLTVTKYDSENNRIYLSWNGSLSYIEYDFENATKTEYNRWIDEETGEENWLVWHWSMFGEEDTRESFNSNNRLMFVCYEVMWYYDILTFDEETNTYYGSTGGTTVKVVFENGNVKSIEITENFDDGYSYSYKYEISGINSTEVTVPQAALDVPKDEVTECYASKYFWSENYTGNLDANNFSVEFYVNGEYRLEIVTDEYETYMCQYGTYTVGEEGALTFTVDEFTINGEQQSDSMQLEGVWADINEFPTLTVSYNGQSSDINFAW